MSGPMSGSPVRIGIIGFGIRGPQLCRAIGFATKDWLENIYNGLINYDVDIVGAR